MFVGYGCYVATAQKRAQNCFVTDVVDTKFVNRVIANICVHVEKLWLTTAFKINTRTYSDRKTDTQTSFLFSQHHDWNIEGGYQTRNVVLWQRQNTSK